MSEIVTLQNVMHRKSEPVVDHPGYRPAGAIEHEGAVVSASTKAAVLRHLACHMSASLRQLRPPRMLVIAAKPGTGKDFQLSLILSEAGFDSVSFPAALLAGSAEGAPIAYWIELSAFIKAKTKETGRPIAICMEDLELGILAPGPGVECTVNTSTANGLFQSELSFDNPMAVDCDGTPAPLFATGNDFQTGFRSSLLRDGRARHIQHHMTRDELSAAIAWILGTPPEWSAALIAKHPDQGLAFYNAISTSLADARIDALVNQHGCDGIAIDKALAGKDISAGLTRKAVFTAAQNVAAARAKNFMTKTKETQKETSENVHAA